MVLGKLLKDGSLVLAGVLVGGLLSYNSQKSEIIEGINDISELAIDYKTQTKELTSQKETLKETINTLEEQIENLTTEVEKLVSEKTILEQEKAELEKQANIDSERMVELIAEIERLTKENDELIAEIERLTKEKEAEIARLNDLIAFKDTLLQTTYEKAMELEGRVEDLTKQLEDSKNGSQSLLDKANEEIAKANQDQVDILDAINQAKEKIKNLCPALVQKATHSG